MKNRAEGIRRVIRTRDASTLAIHGASPPEIGGKGSLSVTVRLPVIGARRRDLEYRDMERVVVVVAVAEDQEAPDENDDHATYRKEQGWSGEWSGARGMDDVVKSLRGLRIK
ncbi:hypothetical protein C8R45DRAFT_1101903 [Mycena sanguinolenta]|nr:hypothetical protein C8R45DRAFT_1101903 [Mycena sanguinolenta]